MNNNNGKNRDKAAEQTDIITKKGFLISLPGKKNSKPSTTSINLAKPVQTSEKSAIKPAVNASPDRNNSEKKGLFGFKNKNRQKSDNDRKDSSVPKEVGKPDKRGEQKPSAQKQNRPSNSDGDKAQNHQSNSGERRRNDRRPNRNQNNQNGSNSTKQNNQNQNNRGGQNRPAQNQQRAQNAQGTQKQQNTQNQPRPQRRPDQNRNDKPRQNQPNHPVQANRANERQPVKTDKPDKSEKASLRPNRNGENRRRNDNKPSKPSVLPPISALSGELADFSAKASQTEAVKLKEKEIPLEEKYKDAIPLAEQIAAEEAARRGNRIASEAAQEKQEIVGIRFREAGKIYYFDPDGRNIEFGTPVVVETARGSEYGFTAIANRMIPSGSIVQPLKKIERLATEADTQKYNANKELEKQGEQVFREKVAKLGLEMNLIYVEYTFDNSKLLFYFTAETRIDFRELVKELAGVFRTRIELRQIGVRDEAKVLGGLGVCGRATCCSTFLGDFAQVSIKMAKDQSLSLNAAKISGACGKLMCCLRYEDKVYEQENQRTPKVGAIVDTPDGKGTVTERNALKGTVNVVLEATPEVPAKTYNRDNVTIVGFNRQENEHVDESADEIKDDEN